MKVPAGVISRAECIGGYLGHDVEYFDAEGNEVPTSEGASFMAVGNYYGSSIFVIKDGKVERYDAD